MAQAQVENRQNVRSAKGDLTAAGAVSAMVRVDVLRKFVEVTKRLGGDPDDLLNKAQIDPALLANRHAFVPYRSFVQLLERAAVELRCSDFGMRLAAEQSLDVGGPLEVAMRNAGTLRDAYRYCTDHVQAYSTGATLFIDEESAKGVSLVRIEIATPKLPPHPQTIEHGLMLLQNAVADLTNGQVRPREIWITHEPVSDLATYREHFGDNVRFGQSLNAVVLAPSDLDLPIPNSDPELYELATSFIEQRFPSAEPGLSTRVRTIVERLLIEGNCTYGGVAAQLGVHPRTLQRRLRAEGESFEAIKDGVRRDIALRYLKQPSIPLIRVAEMLGYSETSVLSRSCYRWFSASPRQLRGGAAPVTEERPAAKSA